MSISACHDALWHEVNSSLPSIHFFSRTLDCCPPAALKELSSLKILYKSSTGQNPGLELEMSMLSKITKGSNVILNDRGIKTDVLHACQRSVPHEKENLFHLTFNPTKQN